MTIKQLLFCLASASLLTACGEGTSVQRDYIEGRDQCREIAELRAGVSQTSAGARQKALLESFKGCMDKQGWAMSGLKEDTPPPPVNVAPQAVAVQPLAPASGENPNARRAAECSYARHASSHSSNARALAKACEIECRNQKRLAPDMPNPAACSE